MTEQDPRGRNEAAPTPPLHPRLKRLLCRRIGEQIEPRDHERCSYCHGRLPDIETGHHEAFCDYRPGVDPVHFGFPTEERRFEQG